MSTFFYAEMRSIRDNHRKKPYRPLKRISPHTIDNLTKSLRDYARTAKDALTLALHEKLRSMGLHEGDLGNPVVTFRNGLTPLLEARKVIEEIERDVDRNHLSRLFTLSRMKTLEKCMKGLKGSRSFITEKFTLFCLYTAAFSLIAILCTPTIVPLFWAGFVSGVAYVALSLAKDSSGVARALETLLTQVASLSQQLTAHCAYESRINALPAGVQPVVTVNPREVTAPPSPGPLSSMPHPNNHEPAFDITSHTNNSPTTLCLFDAPLRKANTFSHGHPSEYRTNNTSAEQQHYAPEREQTHPSAYPTFPSP